MQCDRRISSICSVLIPAAFSIKGRYFEAARPPICRLVRAASAVLLMLKVRKLELTTVSSIQQLLKRFLGTVETGPDHLRFPMSFCTAVCAGITSAAERLALPACGRAWILLGSRKNSKRGKCPKMPQNPTRQVHALLARF